VSVLPPRKPECRRCGPTVPRSTYDQLLDTYLKDRKAVQAVKIAAEAWQVAEDVGDEDSIATTLDNLHSTIRALP
jgi:hypothetical protein